MMTSALRGFFIPVAALLLFEGATAQAAITVTDAKIAAGRLVVTGTSDIGETVSLDGRYTTDVAGKSFTFNLVYSPASCIVSVGAPGTTAPNVRALVANCAPMPFNPAGEWKSDTRYAPNDLVERNGTTYVALTLARPNLNEDPLVATNFWRALPAQNATADRTLIVGPKGERGEAGHDGVKGDKGEDGALAGFVLHTIKAELKRPATENGQPKGDWTVTSTGSLAVTVAKADQPHDADLLISGTTVADFARCTLAATIFDVSGEKAPVSLNPLRQRGDMIALAVDTPRATTHIEALLLCPRAN